MWCSLRKSVLGAAVLLAMSVNLHAGDYYPPEQTIEDTQTQVVEFGTGWYLRGDIGVSVTEVDPEFSLGGVGNGENVGYMTSVGVGAGYRVNEFFRLDGTVDQFTNFGYDTKRAISCGVWDHDGDPLTPDIAITGNCNERESLEASATVLMLNAYLDLGNYGGFTPYVGAGIGAAYVRWTDYNLTGTCVLTAVTDCQGGALTTMYNNNYASNKEWKPAAAIMAGFSYDLTKNLKLDAGYKFTYISSGDAASNVPVGAGFGAMKYDSFNIHQVRVGLRYEIW